MRHMDEGVLQAWLDGARGGLTEEERAEVAEHLAECTACAARVEVLRQTTDRVTGILSSPEMADDEIPDFESVVARSRELEPASRPNRRWIAPAWAATVVLALGLGWVANELSRRPVEPTPPAPLQAAADATDRDPVPQSAERSPEARVALAPEEEAPSAPTAVAEAPPETLNEAPSRRQRAVVEGRVTDAATGRPLQLAQVYVPGAEVGGLTNAEGRFRLELDRLVDTVPDQVAIQVDMIGYAGKTREVSLAPGGSTLGDIPLEATALQLQEMVVTAARGETPAVAPWRAMTLEEATEEVGFEARAVPGLETRSVEVGQINGRVVVRVVQTLEGGGRLILLQSEGELPEGLDAPEGENAESTTLDDGVIVLARASIEASELRALLARLSDAEAGGR